MPEFIPGLRLSELFYGEVVRPILEREFPGLAYSAALIGPGSDVLGYDTARSTDHEWGPRLLLFLPDDVVESYREPIRETLGRQLPYTFRGYSTHFGPTEEDGIRVAREIREGPVAHKVLVHGIRGYFRSSLGVDLAAELTPADWLLLPEQRLLEATAGAVFHDGLGQLEAIRGKLAYFPREVWLFLLGAQWRRIAQLEAFIGRTGEVGDELGSRLVAATLVRDLMRLAFFQERTYAPYPKWFGTAFARLRRAPTLGPILAAALAASTWPEREGHLARAYELLAEQHNALGITPPMEAKVSPFWDRPFQVIHADRFVAAIDASIADPSLRALLNRAGRARYGSLDQISDSTDVLSYPAVSARLRALYETEPSDRP